ncbi:uncharacterized protein LOC128718615 [Anopheles marshallii]|uniref:uncharacterized protein LOC128718615 n=1 Tax=Anopheles marshallii TaxID=1521116 RepID=UPI00237A2E0D|nr:uncharacterized protein LOC128718615 [Anopheles marshallii]
MGTIEANEQSETPMDRKTLEAYFSNKFKEIIDKVQLNDEEDSNVKHLKEFDSLLQDDRLKRLEVLIEEKKYWESPNAIPLPKSFLYYARLQPVLVQMLKNSHKYQDYLKRFIIRFNAENENTAPNQTPKSESDAMKPSAPIHYAVLQLNGDFLDWLLARPNIDVNLRDSFKRTGLMLLCENYDQCMQKPSNRLEKIKILVKKLLNAGADFNICSIHMKLPFDLLLKHCGHEETRSFVEECVKLAPGALAICSVNDRNERVVGFFNNNPDVIVTVELLEIFLRYTDRTKFDVHMRDFKVNEGNVKKVIRLLLHTACDQKLSDCVRFILARGEKDIFKVVHTSNTEVKGTKEKKGFELEHRLELKGLLKKICLMGDLSLLQRFLTKISDPILLNEDALLIHTLRKAHYTHNCFQEKNALLACAEYLAAQKTLNMSKKDNSGNTSLHLALKYGFDSVAQLLLCQWYSYLGMSNKDNQTPLDCGTYDFFKNYFDSCIEVNSKRLIPDRDEIRFNMNGFYPPLQYKSAPVVSNSTNESAGNGSTNCWKRILHKVERCIQHNSTKTATEMTTLQHIANSKELKRLLLHPVLNTFIMVKWMRLCQWNFLNLLLTTFTTLSFSFYSLTACSADGPSTVWLVLSIFGVVFVVIRELLQLLFLRRSYLSFENVLDIVNAIVMAVVLGIGCHGLMSSFAIISLAMQLTFLLGSVYPTKFATIIYMFKTVSLNFLISFGFFSPLILAFIYAFHLTYNQSPEEQKQNCDKDGCAEDDFNNFRSFWNATVKTLVMTTGEFDAADLDFEGGKMLLFIAFLFFAPIVILNLINGLAVSDIAAIREESELISISKKVMLLEQYERGVANVYPAWLKRCFPKPFFSEYQCWIHVKTKEFNKIVLIKGQNEEHKKIPKSDHYSEAKPVQDVQNNSNNVLHESPKPDVSNTNNGRKASKRKSEITSNGRNEKSETVNTKMLEKPIAKFPSLFTCDTGNSCLEISFIREALFMYLDQSIVDEALDIIEKRNGNASHGASKGRPTAEPPISNILADKDRQQCAVSHGPSSKQRIDKLSAQGEDDVLRKLADLKEQLKTVQEVQLKSVSDMLEQLKPVLELVRLQGIAGQAQGCTASSP